MKKIQFAAVACGAAFLSAGVWSQSNANEETGKTAPVAAAPAASDSSAVDSEGFRASQFEGVRVREVPASPSQASKAGGQGWIAVKPGAIGRQNAPVRSNVGDVTWRKGKGNTARGGEKLVPSSPFLHASQATRGKSGAICLQCVHAAQAKAAGKSAVKASKGARKYLGQHTHAGSWVRKSTAR